MADLTYALLTGRFAVPVGDGPDVDAYPDTIWFSSGEVTVEPLVKVQRMVDASPAPVTFASATFNATVDEEGYLSFNGSRGLWVVDLTDPNLNPRIDDPTGATHRISMRLNAVVGGDTLTYTFNAVTVRITAEGDGASPDNANDYARIAPVPTVEAVAITRGEPGVGIVAARVDAGDLVLETSDGDELNAGELPVGPGGSDAGVASYVASPGSATRMQLSTSYSSLFLLNIRDYGAVCDGVTNDTLAIRAAVQAVLDLRDSGDAHPNGILIPHGTTRIEVNGSGPAAGINSGSGTKFAVVVPSDFIVAGEGPTSIVKMTGVPATDYGNPGHNSALGVLDGSHDIVFRDFTVIGENGEEDDGFMPVSNNDSAAIDIVLTETRDVTVQDVTFRNLYGFSVHDRGENTRVNVKDCVTLYCANGINANASNSHFTGNVLLNSEGLECAGQGSLISNNTITDALGNGISAGGNNTPGVITPGIVVSFNTIDGSSGIGISVIDANCHGTIVGNNVRRTAKNGILITSSGGGRLSFGNLIANNTVVSAGLSGAPASDRIGIFVAGTGAHTVVGNHSVDGALAGYDQFYGVYVTGAVAGTKLSANKFRGTSAHDVKIEGGDATNIQLDLSNDFRTYSASGGASLATTTDVAPSYYKGTQTFEHHLVMNNGGGLFNFSVTVGPAASSASRHSGNDMAGQVIYTGSGTPGDLFTVTYARPYSGPALPFLQVTDTAGAGDLYIPTFDANGFTVASKSGHTGTRLPSFFVIGLST